MRPAASWASEGMRPTADFLSTFGMLARLPPDIRNCIYELVVILPANLSFDQGWKNGIMADLLGGYGESICHRCLPPPPPKDMSVHFATDPLWLQNHVQRPALTRVNKGIRAESLPMFYGMLNFTMNSAIHIYHLASCQWLVAIGSANRQRLLQISALCTRFYNPPVTFQAKSNYLRYLDTQQMLESNGFRATLRGWDKSTEHPWGVIGRCTLRFEGDEDTIARIPSARH